MKLYIYKKANTKHQTGLTNIINTNQCQKTHTKMDTIWKPTETLKNYRFIFIRRRRSRVASHKDVVIAEMRALRLWLFFWFHLNYRHPAPAQRNTYISYCPNHYTNNSDFVFVPLLFCLCTREFVPGRNPIRGEAC